MRDGRRTAVRANSFPAKCRLTARDQDASDVRVDEPAWSYIHADLKNFSAPILRNAPVGLPIPTVPTQSANPTRDKSLSRRPALQIRHPAYCPALPDGRLKLFCNAFLKFPAHPPMTN